MSEWEGGGLKLLGLVEVGALDVVDHALLLRELCFYLLLHLRCVLKQTHQDRCSLPNEFASTERLWGCGEARPPHAPVDAQRCRPAEAAAGGRRWSEGRGLTSSADAVISSIAGSDSGAVGERGRALAPRGESVGREPSAISPSRCAMLRPDRSALPSASAGSSRVRKTLMNLRRE